MAFFKQFITLGSVGILLFFLAHCSKSSFTDLVVQPVGSSSSTIEGTHSVTLETIKALGDSLAHAQTQLSQSENVLVQNALQQKIDSLSNQLQYQSGIYIAEQDSILNETQQKIEFLHQSDGSPRTIQALQITYDSLATVYAADKSVITSLLAGSGLEVSGSSSSLDSLGNALSSSAIDSIGDSLAIQDSSVIDSQSTIQQLSIDTLLPDTLYTFEDSALAIVINAHYVLEGVLSWSIIDSIENGTLALTSLGDTAFLTVTPTAQYFGSLQVLIEVTDGTYSDTASILVVIHPSNDNPEYTGVGEIKGILVQGETLTLFSQGACIDTIDTGMPTPTVSFLWYNDIDTLGANGTLIGAGMHYVLTPGDIGKYVYGVVLCTDMFGTQAQYTTPYTAQVSQLNTPPVIDTVPKIVDSLLEDTEYVFAVSVTDADNDSLAVLISDSTENGVIVAQVLNDTMQIQYKPELNVFGLDSAVIIIAAGVHFDTITFHWTIDPVNDAPVIVATNTMNSALRISSTPIINATCTDPIEGSSISSITYEWFEDRDTLGFDGAVLSSNKSYNIVDSNALRYLYGIVRCEDSEGAITYDTTQYSIRLIPDNVGTVNKALEFDGVDAYVELDKMNLIVASGVTIEFWVRWNDFTNNARIFELGNGTEDIIRVSNSGLTNDLVIECWSGTSPHSFTVPNSISLNSWTHLALTIAADGSALVYKNGEQIAAGIVGAPVMTQRVSNWLGGSEGQTEDYFSGILDDFRIWNGVRTAQEIKDSLYATILGTENGLSAAFNFNHTNGHIVKGIWEQLYGLNHNMNGGSNWVNEYQKRTVTFSVSEGGYVGNGSSNEVVESMELFVVASPKSGYRFHHWTVSGQVTISDSFNDTTIAIVTGSGAQLRAEFVKDTFIDARDGNSYWKVTIGAQVWMAQNLRYLPSVHAPSDVDDASPRYYVYNNTSTDSAVAVAHANYEKFGALYNWAASLTDSTGVVADTSSANPSGVQGVCPSGWHLPSSPEWQELEDTVAALAVGAVGTVLKADSTWNSNSGTDDLNFSALGAGYLNGGTNSFQGLGTEQHWWVSEQHTATHSFNWVVTDGSPIFVEASADMRSGMSVRCIKN